MRLVISDVHIGDKTSDPNLDKLFQVLKDHAGTNNQLILNGDIFDLIKCPYFDERHFELLSIAHGYGDIIYVEGNHDWLSPELYHVCSKITYLKEYSFQTGKDLKCVTCVHGHQTDWTCNYFPKISRSIIKAYYWIEKLLDMEIQQWFWKRKFMQNYFIPRQRQKLVDSYHGTTDVLVTGHVHKPGIMGIDGIQYYNTGNWMGDGYAAYLIIDGGQFELVRV
jgi:UDP-2,3-diacylglucosamine pyrophosphatase LpxH